VPKFDTNRAELRERGKIGKKGEIFKKLEAAK
jgi:hypothetical protein